VVEMPEAGGHGLTVSSPMFIQGHEKVPPAPAPSRTGEDTRDILATLGYDDEAIAELYEAGVVDLPTAAEPAASGR
jgi:crotonobetainyl-CoA:carnitine CoA-transferase CaiB-like acyl-CoA transferase